MIREHIMPTQAHDHGFRWRAREPSRIEGLSDAVFGFSITLLVVSLEVSKSFSELVHAMSGFAAFAASFVLLMLVWYQQYLWFRRYAIEDTMSVVLNATLLFVVIFYVYPLKFLAGVFSAAVGFTQFESAGGEPMITLAQMPALMAIYSAGFAAVYVIFFLLYRHAWQKRAALELTPLEIIETRFSLIEHAIMVGIGLLAFGLAISRYPQFSGMSFMLIPVGQTIQGTLRGRAQRRLEAGVAG